MSKVGYKALVEAEVLERFLDCGDPTLPIGSDD